VDDHDDIEGALQCQRCALEPADVHRFQIHNRRCYGNVKPETFVVDEPHCVGVAIEGDGHQALGGKPERVPPVAARDVERLTRSGQQVLVVGQPEFREHLSSSLRLLKRAALSGVSRRSVGTPIRQSGILFRGLSQPAETLTVRELAGPSGGRLTSTNRTD